MPAHVSPEARTVILMPRPRLFHARLSRLAPAALALVATGAATVSLAAESQPNATMRMPSWVESLGQSEAVAASGSEPALEAIVPVARPNVGGKPAPRNTQSDAPVARRPDPGELYPGGGA